MWLQNVLDELKVLTIESIKMYYDNQTSRSIVKSFVRDNRTKHIEINHHVIKEKTEEEIISLINMHFSLQTVDIFSKALSRINFKILNPSYE